MDTPQLVVIGGPDKEKRFDVLDGSHALGRHADAAYQVADPRVSRLHCDIVRVSGAFTVRDRGGSGGIIVNGHKVPTHALRHGDIFQLGDTTVRFQTGPIADADTLSSGGLSAEYDPKATEELAELAGRTLAHFRLGAVLGKGSSSVVFKATDVDDGKDVALKVMHPAFSRDEEEMQRFVRAMKTMLPLKHPHLVTLYGAGKSGPYCWAALEFVAGESLNDVIRRIGVAGMLDWKHAYRVGVHVARALDYAHKLDIIHRHITPANILVRAADKQAMLGDLMLAKALSGTHVQQVTKAGQMLGDIDYMSPERTAEFGDSVDARSDLYSLGATMYALLTGKPPFASRSTVETITRIRQSEPAKPSAAQMGIPSSFEAVVLKLMAKRSADRYQTAGDLLKELEKVGRLNGATA